MHQTSKTLDNKIGERDRQTDIQFQQDAALLNDLTAIDTQEVFDIFVDAVSPGRRIQHLLVRDIEGV